MDGARPIYSFAVNGKELRPASDKPSLSELPQEFRIIRNKLVGGLKERRRKIGSPPLEIFDKSPHGCRLPGVRELTASIRLSAAILTKCSFRVPQPLYSRTTSESDRIYRAADRRTAPFASARISKPGQAP